MPTTGVERIYYNEGDENRGRLREEYFVYQDKVEGTYREYDEHGHFVHVWNVVNGILEGEYREYTGDIMTRQGYYAQGELHGEFRTYDPIHGTLLSKRQYVHGKQHGASVSYHNTTGKVHESFNYVNDQMHGDCYIYDATGTIAKEMHYVHDELHGSCRTYDMYGLAEVANYSHGKAQGFTCKFNSKGKIIKCFVYLRGRLIAAIDYNKDNELETMSLCLPCTPIVVAAGAFAAVSMYSMVARMVCSFF